MKSTPNFLFICTDQQRSDSLGCAGNKQARSPHIDRIATEGVRFTRHSTPMQICSPSRATMLTGLYPRHHRLAMNGMALPAEIPVLTDLLAEGGYRTHGVGKQHLQPLLAPEKYRMPDSRAFWNLPESEGWAGPYYGYQTLDLLLGESDTAHLAGHYANWLKQNHPESVNLLTPGSATEPPPADLDEIWRSEMPAEHHYNSWITDRSVDFISQQQDADQPFFLFVSYPDPHHPFDPPAAYADRFDPATMPLPVVVANELSTLPPYYSELYPTGEGFRELYWAGRTDLEAGSMITTENVSDQSMARAIAYTHAMINMIDDGVGKMIGSLESTGLSDNTVVIFTSDHGELLGDHGLLHKGPPSYRQLTEVSMLIKGPGIAKGNTVTGMTNHVDLAPTVLGLAGIDPSGLEFDGINMQPLLQGQAEQIRHYDFGEYHPTVYSHLYNQTVRTEQWRLTIYPERPEWGELFDLNTDPSENHNLFNQSDSVRIIEQLRRVLAQQFPPQPAVENEWICKW